jgi:hypothetical protein
MIDSMNHGGFGRRMSTAILRIYTGDGFLIAADGLAKEKDGSVSNLAAQKIFSFGAGGSLAYSIAGRSKIGPDDSPRISFSFEDQLDEATLAIPMDQHATLTEFAKPLSQRILRALTAACLADEIRFDDATWANPGELGHAIAYVFIDGYYKGLESSVTIRFYHCEERFGADVQTPGIVTGAVFCHGSLVVRDLIHQNDPRFCNERYLRPLDVPAPRLSEKMLNALIYSRVYIEACSSSEGLALDKDICSGIGGYPHTATITRMDGFQWVPGFEYPPATAQP